MSPVTGPDGSGGKSSGSTQTLSTGMYEYVLVLVRSQLVFKIPFYVLDPAGGIATWPNWAAFWKSRIRTGVVRADIATTAIFIAVVMRRSRDDGRTATHLTTVEVQQ